MNAETRVKAMRFLLNGMQRTPFAPEHELITRFTSLLGSEVAAQEALKEAVRIGLLVPGNIISEPTPPERLWRLSETFDDKQLEVPA